jgi:hypothetical protein
VQLTKLYACLLELVYHQAVKGLLSAEYMTTRFVDVVAMLEESSGHVLAPNLMGQVL